VTNPTPLKTVWELYPLLEKLEAQLRANGEGTWASRIEDTVRGGSTSGEILTYLANDLDALIEAGVPQRLGLCPDITRAARFVYETLNAVGQLAPPPETCA
jgi:hypothetical protein